MTDIEAIIAKIDAMKPIPQIAHKVMAIAKDPESSMADLAKVISVDAAVSASVLKLANSPYFGARGRIDSIQRALMMLGMNQVVDLVVMSASSENIKGEQAGYELRENELWKHAVSSAQIAKDLAGERDEADDQLVFTAALIKDIGKSIMSQYVAEALPKIDELVESKGISFIDAEHEVVGIDHAELGARVAEKWSFHPKLIDIIRHHHEPTEAECKTEATIVYVADSIAVMMGVGIGADGFMQKFQNEVVDFLGLTEEDVDKIATDYALRMDDIDALIGLA